MPPAIIGGAVLGAGAIGASAQAKAAKKAANAQVEASREATQLQRDIYNDQRNLLAPSIQSGAEARAQQMLMQGFSPAQVRAFLTQTQNSLAAPVAQPSGTLAPQTRPLGGIFGNLLRGNQAGSPLETVGGAMTTAAAPTTTDPYSWVDNWSYQASSPSYGFRLGEGEKAIERSAAARGRLFSGATGRALQQYGQAFASQEFENDFNRLGALSGTGGAATNNLVGQAGAFGQSAGQNINNAGAARASSYLARGNVWGNFWGNTVPGAIGMYGSSKGWG